MSTLSNFFLLFMNKKKKARKLTIRKHNNKINIEVFFTINVKNFMYIIFMFFFLINIIK